jgi:hypothetical protein
MAKTKFQAVKLTVLIDPMDTAVTIKGLMEALESAGAKSVELSGTTMRLVVKPEIGGEK